MNRRFDKDRDERAKRVSQEIVVLERAARDAKTSWLREARLAQEASAPRPDATPIKLNRTFRKKGRKVVEGE